MDLLLSLAGCFALPVVGVGIVLLAIWIFRLNKADKNKRARKRFEQLSALRKKGVTAPAIVLSAKNGFSSGPDSGSQETSITFQLEVQPEGRAAFQATFQDWVPGRGYRYRADDAGRKIWVTYDLNDTSQMMFEYYDEDRKHLLGRADFDKLQKRYDVIRKTGEEGLAVILETEDLEITNVIERDHLKQTIMRMKLEVTVKDGQIFPVETQALFANASLHKYAVGKKVYVKIDPQDRTQVALDRSAE
ncbi:MAG: hypothetical protein IPN58_21530 [Anaerolineales bacterium]|nr:hypothetical protein [Anaerolineales bacterium]